MTMQRSIARACAASALQAPRATPARRRPVAAESEECIALGLETLNEVYAQWGVCVEESTAIKVGGLLFSPQDPRTYGTETVEAIVLTRNPGLGIELLEVANNNEGVGIVVVDGTVAGSSAAAASHSDSGAGLGAVERAIPSSSSPTGAGLGAALPSSLAPTPLAPPPLRPHVKSSSS